MRRVDFKTQNNHGEETELVKAAKAVFANGQPNVWEITVQSMPAFLSPVVRLLARAFPCKAGTEAEAAFATVYGTSDVLIEVINYFYNGMWHVDLHCAAL